MPTHTQKSLLKNSGGGKRFRLSFAAIVAVGAAMSSAHAVPCFDLGQASGYAALILQGGAMQMTVNGGAAVVGDVGVTAGSHLDLGSKADRGPNAGTGTVVSGKIYLDTISDPAHPATVTLQHEPASHVAHRDLTGAMHDAIAANNAAAAMPATQQYSSGIHIRSNQSFTITGNGNCNVISLTSIKFDSKSTLRISGSASDYFIFNITGGYTQANVTSVQLIGGVTSDHILWNFIGDGGTDNTINFGSASAKIGGSDTVAQGIFLAPYRSLSITDATLYGSVISAGTLHIASQALIIGPPTSVPEVSPIWMGPSSLILLVGVHFCRRKLVPSISLTRRRRVLKH